MSQKIGLLALCAILGAAMPAWAADRHEAKATRAAINQFPILYSITGARDDGSADNTGIATTIHCTNPTRFTAQAQFVILNFNTTLAVNQTFAISKSRTFTASTHRTVIYDEDVSLASGVLNEGWIRIFSDNAQLLCSAEVVDAGPTPSFAVTLIARSAHSGE